MSNAKEKKINSKKSESSESSEIQVSIDKSFNKRFNKLIKIVEKENPDTSVILAREFRYPLRQTPVEIAISETRKLNLLEEFILRAGTEFNPPPTVKELSKVLGLDTVFVQNTITNLVNSNHIKIDDSKLINLTPQGKECYQKGIILETPEHQTIYAITEPLEKKISFYSQTLEIETLDLPNLDDIIPLQRRIPKLSNLKVNKVQDIIRESELEISENEDEKMVTHMKVTGKSQALWKSVSVLVLKHQTLDKYIIQVRRDKYIFQKISDLLTAMENIVDSLR
ncbi:MAG: hypothetical protein AAF378_14585 [Cyanobacteria bacterium P01_A01_bin.84]